MPSRVLGWVTPTIRVVFPIMAVTLYFAGEYDKATYALVFAIWNDYARREDD